MGWGVFAVWWAVPLPLLMCALRSLLSFLLLSPLTAPEVVGADAVARNPSCPKEGPLALTPDAVASVHHYGGTMLGSDRGGDDVETALAFIKHHGINQLYVIGGDGTHRGANAIFCGAQRAGMPLAVCGLPKVSERASECGGGGAGRMGDYIDSAHAPAGGDTCCGNWHRARL